jgi:hypothetical protein
MRAYLVEDGELIPPLGPSLQDGWLRCFPSPVPKIYSYKGALLVQWWAEAETLHFTDSGERSTAFWMDQHFFVLRTNQTLSPWELQRTKVLYLGAAVHVPTELPWPDDTPVVVAQEPGKKMRVFRVQVGEWEQEPMAFMDPDYGRMED